MTEEALVIVTMRVGDESVLAPGSQKGFVCNDCGEPVWICDTSLPAMQDGNYTICCNRCVGDKLLREKDIEFEAADPEWEEFFRENPEVRTISSDT